MLAIVFMLMIQRCMLKFALTSDFGCTYRHSPSNSGLVLTISLYLLWCFFGQLLASEIKKLIGTPDSASGFEFQNFLYRATFRLASAIEHSLNHDFSTTKLGSGSNHLDSLAFTFMLNFGSGHPGLPDFALTSTADYSDHPN